MKYVPIPITAINKITTIINNEFDTMTASKLLTQFLKVEDLLY